MHHDLVLKSMVTWRSPIRNPNLSIPQPSPGGVQKDLHGAGDGAEGCHAHGQRFGGARRSQEKLKFHGEKGRELVTVSVLFFFSECSDFFLNFKLDFAF